jgi:quercetin dioxygenase-like cupin family protein
MIQNDVSALLGIRPQEKGRPTMPTGPTIPGGEVLALQSLIRSTEQGIASRILAKTHGGNLTLFAFDAGQGLTEHTSPYDALVIVLEGALILTIDGEPLQATPGTIVRMPADVAHAVDAPEPARMLLIMLKDRKEA